MTTAAPLVTRRRWVRSSWARLAITDGVFAFGGVTIVAGLLGVSDDLGDAVALIATGAGACVIGVSGRRAFERDRRPAPSRILTGLAFVWVALVLAGTWTYLVTGAIDRVDDAVVESAAGFSTTSLTTLDPTSLSVPMQLFRAGTQWLGGLVGLIAGIVALPMALRRPGLAPRTGGTRGDRLAPTPGIGRRRVFGVYAVFTVVCGLAFRAVGMGTRDSLVNALTTVSTGGFSSRADSFVGFGVGPRLVATIAMVVAGSSLFVIWWIVRGRRRPLAHSVELRAYLTMIVVTTAALFVANDGLSVDDALFTAASAVSTTGHAVVDWTVFPDFSLAVLLIVVATGSMAGSAGGGLRVLRALVLVRFAARELRTQLDPHAVVVVKHGDQAVDERSLERMTGYQIAHLALCAIGAFALAVLGLSVLGSIWASISAVSTFGPGPATGPFGSLDGIGAPARLALVPLMLAGRLSVLPVLLGLTMIVRAQQLAVRRVRRFVARQAS